MHNVGDNALLDIAGETTTLVGAALTGAWYDMKLYDRGSFLAYLTNNDAANVDITLQAAEDDIGTNAETVKEVTDIVAAGTYLVDFKAEDLPDGKPFVNLVVTETIGGEATIDATIAAFLHDPHQTFENKGAYTQIIKSWE